MTDLGSGGGPKGVLRLREGRLQLPVPDEDKCYSFVSHYLKVRINLVKFASHCMLDFIVEYCKDLIPRKAVRYYVISL